MKGPGTNTAAFSDVQPTAYYAQAVAISKELGIAYGFEDNTFKSSSISRQNMIVLTAKALKAAGNHLPAAGIWLLIPILQAFPLTQWIV